ncbi:MAG: fatty acid--CoA ligase [Pseudomonadota bacterium]
MPADGSQPSLTTLADVLRRQAVDRPDKIAFKFEGDTATFAELNDGASRAANGLLSLGLKPGERVAYLGKNSHLYFEILMGVSKAGGVMCPVNWRLAGPEIAYILNDAKARILFVGPEFTGAARALRGDLNTVEHIFCTEGADDDIPDYAAWRDGFSDEDPHVSRVFEDDALQLYTSGTTGHPKGAVLPNRSLLALRQERDPDDIPDWNRWTAEDVSLVAMPCFHIGGTGWGLTGIFEGATGVVMREFDPLRVLDFIDEHRISKIFMVPAAMKIVVEQPKAREVDFSPLKYMLYGASPIPLDLLKTCMDVFQCGFVQMYGMTETAGTIVALPPEDHDPNGNEKMRSAGKALDGVEVVILDEAGNRLSPGEVGEIAARTDANMKGYWNLDEATAKTIDAEGWLRTGDAGYMDEDGYVYIHDRVKDMIISGGENIYPAEVENAIFGHEAIADVAVIGVPDKTWGEAVKACVVLKDGETATADDVIGFARTRIAAYKCPKSVDFIAALPRNPSGKILRRELRAPYWDGKERSVN